MMRFPLFALLAVSLVSWLLPQAALAQQQPNIVYILADDMGLGDVRSYTPNSPVDTTHLNQLATEGISFTNAHSASAVCSPTRYSILTGRYAWRTRLKSKVVMPHESSLIDPERITIADFLRAQGYATAAVGKWHLGMDWQTTDGRPPSRTGFNIDFSLPFANGPIDHGFDSYYGDDIINWPPFTFMRDDHTVGIPSVRRRNGMKTPGYRQVEVLPAITAEAVEQIDTLAESDKPFFLYFALTAPHSPIVPPDFIPREVGTQYDRFIASVDWSVGQVLAALEANGLDENTLVVFASDNGVSKPFATSDHISPGFVDGTPLRGQKADIWEGGHRIPFMIRWPGEIEAGSQSNAYVELNDFYATVAALLDAEETLTEASAEDSYSLLPLLQGGNVQQVRQTGINHSILGAFAIRQIDEAGTEWKLIFNTGSGGWTEPIGTLLDPLEQMTDYAAVQLYNMTTDPGEQTNLLAEGGSPEMQAKADAMQALLQQFITEGRTAPAR